MALVTDVYEFQEIIGEGSFSNVVLATHNETQIKYAIKIVDKSKIITEVQRERADREIDILKRCNHPNIVKLIETFESDDEISLVMELMNGGDLFDRITSKGVLSETEARAAMKHVFSAVDFLHDRSLVHRDLKPENLLYSSKENDSCVKLSDFGLSKFSNEKDNEGLQTPCGTIAYTAPEITNSKVYRKSVDIWSCGCILYFMLFGRPPFYSEDEEEIYDLVSEGIWSFPDFQVSEQAKDLITKLLEKEPTKRLTVKQAMQHPFLTQLQAPLTPTRAASSLRTSDNIIMNPLPNIAPISPIVTISSTLVSVTAPPSLSTSGGISQSTSSTLSLSLSSSLSPSIGTAPVLSPSTPLTIPHLRASMHSAMDALRGPLTPPLVSPLESSIWKKRAKTRALLLNNNAADLTLDLTSTSPIAYEDKEGFNIEKKLENDSRFSDAMEMDMSLTYQ